MDENNEKLSATANRSGSGDETPTSIQMVSLPGIQEVQYMVPQTVSTLFRQQEKAIVDNRPFLCELCGNRFRQQCHLTQHIRIHTNDRPYHCQHCEKAFKQKSQVLSVHSFVLYINFI